MTFKSLPRKENNNMSGYRQTISSDGCTYSSLVDYGYDDNKESLIPESTVKGVLDSIEDNVNELANLLEDIEGLSEIDLVKSKLKELQYKLY
jgi:hypothetical protein